MRTSEKRHISKELPLCSTCRIRWLGVCSGADDRALTRLEQHKTYRRYVPGERMASAGVDLPQIGTLLSGTATLSRTQDRGTRQIVGLLQPGDILGRPWRHTTPFDVEALTPVEVCAFRTPVFDDLLEEMPGLRTRMIEMIQDDLDAARTMMTILGRKTAREKIVSFLVHLALRQNSTPEHGDCEVDLMLSREQLADILSLTFETVSRQINDLERAGLIVPRTRRIFRIPELQSLIQVSGDDHDGAMIDC